MRLRQQSIKCSEASTLMTWFLLVLWFNITQKQIHKRHTQGPIDWDTHIYVFHRSYLYHNKWIIYKNLLYRGPQGLCFSKTTHLWTSYICWLGSTGPRPCCETQIILIEMASMSKVHTTQSEKERLVSDIPFSGTPPHPHFTNLSFYGKILNPTF